MIVVDSSAPLPSRNALSLMEAGDVFRVAKRREGWEEVLSRRLALFVVVSRLFVTTGSSLYF